MSRQSARGAGLPAGGARQKAGPVEKQLEQRKVSMHEASSVTKDFLLLSQPFINQGILIASASAGRRLYIHHLSEVPLNEVFLTRTGNHLQRTDRQTVKLAGTISLAVEDIPALPVPSVKMTQAIPTSVFAGPLPGRDEAVLKLLHKGKQANGSGDFSTACACFEAAYALSIRAGMLVSAANMRLKLHQPATAAAMYRYVLAECELLPAEKDMACRKLVEAQAVLKSKGIEGSSPQAATGTATQREFVQEDSFASFAAFGFEDAGSDGGGSDGKDSPFGDGDDGFDGAFGGAFDSTPQRSSFGHAFPGAGGVAGTFDADFGDFDDADDGQGGGFGLTQPAPAPVRPPPGLASPGLPSPGGFPAFVSALPVAPWTPSPVPGGPAPPGLAEDDFDVEESLAQTSAAGGFAAFEAPLAPPPAAAPAAPVPATLSTDLPVLGSGAGVPGPAGRVAGDGGSGHATLFAALEERLRALEHNASAPAAGQAELEQRLERLSAHVNRRLGGVKTGMKGLHERLQAVEVAMARLPDHLTRFKEQQRAQARVGAEHAATLRRLEQAIPALSAAAAACAGRVGELTRMQQAISEGGDLMQLLGASGDHGGQVESGQGWGGAAAGETRLRHAAAPAHAPRHGLDASPPPNSHHTCGNSAGRGQQAVRAGREQGSRETEFGQSGPGSGEATEPSPALVAGAPLSTGTPHDVSGGATVGGAAIGSEMGSVRGSVRGSEMGSVRGSEMGSEIGSAMESEMGSVMGGGMEHAMGGLSLRGAAMLSADDFALFGSASAEDSAPPLLPAMDAAPGAPSTAGMEGGFGDFGQEAPVADGAQSPARAGVEDGSASWPSALMDGALAQPSASPRQDSDGVTSIAAGGFGDFGDFGQGDTPRVSAAPSAAGDANPWAEADESRLPGAAEPPPEAALGMAWAGDDDFDAFAGDDGAAAFGALDRRKSGDGLSGLGLDPEPGRVSTGDAFSGFGDDGGPAGEDAPSQGITRTVSDDEFNALFGVEE